MKILEGDVVTTLSGSIDLNGLAQSGPVGGSLNGVIVSDCNTVYLYANYGSRYL